MNGHGHVRDVLGITRLPHPTASRDLNSIELLCEGDAVGQLEWHLPVLLDHCKKQRRLGPTKAPARLL